MSLFAFLVLFSLYQRRGLGLFASTLLVFLTFV